MASPAPRPSQSTEAIRDVVDGGAEEGAEAALGPKFNVRAFHDAVLALGSVPLAEVGRRVDQLIRGGGKGPYPDEE